jgi:hypothetical protein
MLFPKPSNIRQLTDVSACKFQQYLQWQSREGGYLWMSCG